MVGLGGESRMTCCNTLMAMLPDLISALLEGCAVRGRDDCDASRFPPPVSAVNGTLLSKPVRSEGCSNSDLKDCILYAMGCNLVLCSPGLYVYCFQKSIGYRGGIIYCGAMIVIAEGAYMHSVRSLSLWRRHYQNDQSSFLGAADDTKVLSCQIKDSCYVQGHQFESW